MGIFEWIKGHTGAWGPVLLDFYINHAIWINLPIAIYGILLILSWKNLERIRDDLLDQIAAEAEVQFAHGKKQEGAKKLKLADFHPSWQRAMECSRFPWVAGQNGFLPHKASLEMIRRLITDEDLMRRSARRLASLDVELQRK